ncbi:MAG: DNA alkylation repair protein [Crocinitomicaceae bacterium]|nr:DNA alkylation repair protein [Crocinitomicaceae bacterium]
MNLSEVMTYLESKGSEQTRKIYTKHGAPDNFFGVKVADVKPIFKKEKNNHELALELYATGNSDAQYLAGLIADAKKFSKEDLTKWANEAGWYMISEYAVAWNVAENPMCMEICKEWIDSDDIKLQESGWASLSAHLIVTPNEDLDKPYLESLVGRVEKEIHSAANRVKYCMNGFIIALGGAFADLTESCKEAGDRIGRVEVFMGETSCKVPVIRPYLDNMENRDRIGNKKKTAKC